MKTYISALAGVVINYGLSLIFTWQSLLTLVILMALTTVIAHDLESDACASAANNAAVTADP